MESLIPLVVSLLQQTLPLIAGKAPAIASAVSTVLAIAPVIASAYTNLKPVVGRIIAALKADPATTPDQITVLEAAEVIMDHDFDAAADAALAEDAQD